MATSNSTIAILFKAIDEATPTIEKVESSLKSMQEGADKTVASFDKFAGNVQQATEPLANLAFGALKVEGAFLAAGAALTVYAVKIAAEFDTSFRQISTLIDGSDEDLKAFRDAIVAYAGTSTASLEDITSSLAAAIGSGVDYTKSLDLLSVAEKLAVSTRADLTGTTEVLVSTLNAYGMKTEDAGKVADLFFQIIKDGKIEMGDLAQSLAMVTPVAAASGVSLQEVGAAIATLTAAGIQPGQAVEYLRSALSNIIKPSKDASELAAELGIEFSAQALKTKGLAAVLDDVARATGGSTDKMARLIGDVGGLTAALTLTGPQADNFRKAIDSMGNSAGAVDAAFSKMTGGLDLMQKQLANSFKVLMVEIGTPLLDEFGGIAAAIAKIFQSIGASVKGGALADLVKYVESIFGDLKTTLDAVAKNLPAALAGADLSGFTKGIDAVRAAFGLLFKSIDLSTVDGLRSGIELAGGAFLGLSKFTAGVIESFKPMFDLLVEIGEEAATASPAIFELAGNIAGSAAQLNLLAKGAVDLLPAFEALLNLLLLKQGIGLLGSFKNIVAVLPGMATSLLGVGGALLVVAPHVIKLTEALIELKTANDRLSEAQKLSVEVTERATPSIERFAETTGIAVQSLDEAHDLIKNGSVVWDEASSSWVKAGEAIAGVSNAAAKSVDPFNAANEKLLANADASEKASSSAALLADRQAKVGSMVLKTVPIIDQATGKIIGYEQQHVRAEKSSKALGDTSTATGDKIKKAAEEVKKAEAAAKAYQLEMEKLASNERIKIIEARVKLNVAEVEAQAKQIVATFESINTTINSTGDLLGDLFGLFKDLNGMDSSARNEIFDQIDLENRRRDDALKLQRDLTNAQIKVLEAQAQKIEGGDALIKVDGAGLQPHLEAFMWEILKAIQVRVSQDGLKLLLGV